MDVVGWVWEPRLVYAGNTPKQSTISPQSMIDDPPALHHLALGAEDVELGLDEVARHLHDDGTLRSIWLSLGGASVLMVEPAEQGRSDVPHHSQGLFLLALKATPDRSAAVLAELEPESRTRHTQYFRDPEGNRFALSDYPLQ